ncbi:MAG: ABC transporter ATP-binding protein [Limosilactobacillus oris]|jgi:multidrug/hemolysin transport system ATP-binding protein|uniref:ABC transporter ATP-binding protein n=1 Tax=Limosilactobacillus oris TaxID=1632 RepID=UPI00242D7B2D|nr:ABC transporter ATP-binding protein [Limosilactobacillus oris]MCH3911646.1 ABC transporter ATP-binding protein [Limosilactobacillus oris]MCH3938896.1 ABC transporter ATP-binding protein [Limosilactobacillus oris]MCI1981509.1 ABC transporter ATP-binding protein [Limosilactobacillus oris]MCI2043610.1 ABC transporter ATP-binding protein [Limosilactobacillus oris]
MLITTQNLTKKYGNKIAVNQLDLAIPQGALVAYLGTNGAGKSTTINMLVGPLKPTGGIISYAKDLKIGVVFQNSVLDDHLTVSENLQSRAAMYQGIDQDWIERLSKMMVLTKFLHQRYGTLSGGQKRRVDIARALLNHPNLLFLDEPTTGLDIQTRNVIWGLLRKLQYEQGLTIFLTTHYLEEASNAELIYILEEGKVLATGSAAQLKKQYARNSLLLTFKDNTVPEGAKLVDHRRYEINGINHEQALTLLDHYRSSLENFEYRQGDLDDAFVNITGKDIQ